MEDVRCILKKATDSIIKIQRRSSGSAKFRAEEVTKAVEKIGKNMEFLINELDKAGQDAVQTSINLLKGQIAQRNIDIAKAEECKKNQLKNYQRYHKAVKSIGELRSGDIDQCVGSIYCDGHDWLTESITRWEEENKKAEAEIRKLEWQLKTRSQPDELEGQSVAIERYQNFP